jgi:uncharacterized protein
MSTPFHHDMRSLGYLAFPFAMTAQGGAECGLEAHLRDIIIQIIFTSPGERVFRPEWGFGARRYVFEPNREALWEVVRARLASAVTDALAGFADPASVKVDIGSGGAAGDTMAVRISYTLAMVSRPQTHVFEV